MFSPFSSEIRVCDKRCQEEFFLQLEAFGFISSWRMNVSIKLLSLIFKILIIFRNGENNKKAKNLGCFFAFSKKGVYVKEH